MYGQLKTVWPKFLLFKNKIEAINIELINYKYTEDNKDAEFITPPILVLKDKQYECIDDNKRVSKAKDNEYTHMLCYVADNQNEIDFFNRLNDLTYIKDLNKEKIEDFEFIFTDKVLSSLAINECKHLFKI
jgi:hypothetical protein